MENNEKAIQLIKRIRDAFETDERIQAENQWIILSKYIMPTQSGSFTYDGVNSVPGGKVTGELMDSTGPQANHDLSAAINSTLTNPATDWSKFRFKQEELNSDEEALTWLESVTKMIHEGFNDSNFSNEVAKGYRSITAFGNMALMFEEDTNEETGQFEGFRFNALHLGEVAWSENHKGEADTVYRRIQLTARQAAGRFGVENLPEAIQLHLETNPDKYSQYYHVIAPRDKSKVKLVNGISPPEKRPIESIYICSKEPKILEEGGYYEMPIFVVRWENAPTEVYARGPGHMAIPDVRTLNEAKSLYMLSLEKALNPPMIINERAVIANLSSKPGKISVVKDIDGIKELNTAARFDIAHFAFQDYEAKINKAFYVDKLLLPPRDTHGEMTAYETQQRVEQMNRVLGPTIGRFNNDLLKPLVVRAFKILLRAGKLGQIPDVIRENGLDVDIEFVNQLARSQQAQEVSAVQAWIQMMGAAAQLGKPEGMDWVKIDDIAVKTARTLGVPESSIENDDIVQQIRQQRAQMQQQQMQLENQMKAADIQSKQPQV